MFNEFHDSNLTYSQMCHFLFLSQKFIIDDYRFTILSSSCPPSAHHQPSIRSELSLVGLDDRERCSWPTLCTRCSSKRCLKEEEICFSWFNVKLFVESFFFWNKSLYWASFINFITFEVANFSSIFVTKFSFKVCQKSSFSLSPCHLWHNLWTPP